MQRDVATLGETGAMDLGMTLAMAPAHFPSWFLPKLWKPLKDTTFQKTLFPQEFPKQIFQTLGSALMHSAGLSAYIISQVKGEEDTQVTQERKVLGLDGISS